MKLCELLGQLVEEVATVHMPITSGSVRTIFRRPYLTLSSGGSSFGFLLSPSEKQKSQLGVAVDIQRTTIPWASASHGYADGGDKHGKAQRASCKEPPWMPPSEQGGTVSTGVGLQRHPWPSHQPRPPCGCLETSFCLSSPQCLLSFQPCPAHPQALLCNLRTL